MVKTLRFPSAQPHDSSIRLDATRISGISSAIVLHLVALGLLMMLARIDLTSHADEPRTRFEPVFAPPKPPPRAARPVFWCAAKPRPRIFAACMPRSRS